MHSFAKEAMNSFTKPNILSSRTSLGVVGRELNTFASRTLAINGGGVPVKVFFYMECNVFCVSTVKTPTAASTIDEKI